MTDSERDQLLATALSSDVASVITRGTGDPGDRHHRRPGEGQAAGWDTLQQLAAYELARLWRAARPIIGGPKGYTGASIRRGCVDVDEGQDAQEAWRGYCNAMEEVKRRCSARHEQALRLVVVYEEPSRLATAWLVREALSHLADWWKLK
jgi:hypothetical protein